MSREICMAFKVLQRLRSGLIVCKPAAQGIGQCFGDDYVNKLADDRRVGIEVHPPHVLGFASQLVGVDPDGRAVTFSLGDQVPELGDIDLDGDLDLFITAGPVRNGMLQTDYVYKNLLVENGTATFERHGYDGTHFSAEEMHNIKNRERGRSGNQLHPSLTPRVTMSGFEIEGARYGAVANSIRQIFLAASTSRRSSNQLHDAGSDKSQPQCDAEQFCVTRWVDVQGQSRRQHNIQPTG